MSKIKRSLETLGKRDKAWRYQSAIAVAWLIVFLFCIFLFLFGNNFRSQANELDMSTQEHLEEGFSLLYFRLFNPALTAIFIFGGLCYSKGLFQVQSDVMVRWWGLIGCTLNLVVVLGIAIAVVHVVVFASYVDLRPEAPLTIPYAKSLPGQLQYITGILGYVMPLAISAAFVTTSEPSPKNVGKASTTVCVDLITTIADTEQIAGQIVFLTLPVKTEHDYTCSPRDVLSFEGVQEIGNSVLANSVVGKVNGFTWRK